MHVDNKTIQKLGMSQRKDFYCIQGYHLTPKPSTPKGYGSLQGARSVAEEVEKRKWVEVEEDSKK